MKFYIPKMYQKNIFSINYDYLKEKGIKYLIFDLDNTLGLIDEEICNEKTKDFINKLSIDFKIIIASNNNFKRVNTFAKDLNTSIISFALKPSGKVYRHMKKQYTKNMNEVCIIGDQITTDIITGNRFGIYTILVDPLGKKDLKITSFNRYLEEKFMKKINLKRGEYYCEKN